MTKGRPASKVEVVEEASSVSEDHSNSDGQDGSESEDDGVLTKAKVLAELKDMTLSDMCKNLKVDRLTEMMKTMGLTYFAPKKMATAKLFAAVQEALHH